jgi:hypothetical protein
MKAKDMVIDFVNFVFLFAISLFVFFYFILGERLELAQKIVKACMYLSFFGLIFVVKTKTAKRDMAALDSEERLNEIVAYLDERDKLKDLAVMCSLPVVIIAVAALNGTSGPGDILQALGVFSAAVAWHAYLFRVRDSAARLRYVTNLDTMADSVVTSLLPIVHLSLSFLFGGADTLDLIQALLIFLLIYGWHKYLLRRRDR